MESILLERVSPNPSNLHSSLTEHSPISIIEPKFLINSFAFLIDTPFMLVSKSSRRSSVDNLLCTCGCIVSLETGFTLLTDVIISAASSSDFTQIGLTSVSNIILERPLEIYCEIVLFFPVLVVCFCCFLSLSL